ncbi:MAG: hypothetical protein KAJ24_06155 [Candidatus Aenigmarchaeota archaeon]|nr:hypothetical protein [Candidatus Aenigmarchaeota archaeon]
MSTMSQKKVVTVSAEIMITKGPTSGSPSSFGTKPESHHAVIAVDESPFNTEKILTLWKFVLINPLATSSLFLIIWDMPNKKKDATVKSMNVLKETAMKIPM